MNRDETKANEGGLPHGASTADVLGGTGIHLKTEAIPPQWRWHYRVLLELQKSLLQRQSQTRQAVREPLEMHSMDEADSATDEFDHDLALSQLAAEQDALYEIDAALARVRNGKYGICEETGQLIPDARLKAVPWTRFTLKVEKRLEKEKLLNSTRLNKPGTVRRRGRPWFRPEEETLPEPSFPAADETFSPSPSLPKNPPGMGD